MAKYKFIKEHIATERIWKSEIGVSSAVMKSVTFKVGDEVDGDFVSAHVQTDDDAPRNIPDQIVINNPMHGKYGTEWTGGATRFVIPMDKLQIISQSIVATTKEPITSIFTTKNIVIGLAAFAALFGILKWQKVI
jgi:hypothetical protein